MTHVTDVELLRRIVTRIEAHEAEIAELREQIKDDLRHAKSSGYDIKVLRKLIGERKRDPGEVQEEEAIRALYRDALQGTPLGDNAERAKARVEGAFGTPVELTEAQIEAGVMASFVGEDGTTSTISRA